MEKKRCNDTCAVCASAHNSINGRYCQLLKRYVEYAKVPPCTTNKTVNI
ncbi:MAG: hypothetical protein IKN48_10705 [Bacteroidaceae bacterium]|nr:hypothetical protein [Bacteroidaceae bacterium]